MEVRIGQGVDVHPFCTGRPLFLGGVQIETNFGLKGHSDADVLLHALTDAVLGALGWGDIGCWFPDTDMSFKDLDSAIFVERVWAKVTQEGWRLVNCDCTILAQKPRISPYMQKMRERIAGLLSSTVDRVSIKATTTEHLGFIGREEGILASAVVLLEAVSYK